MIYCMIHETQTVCRHIVYVAKYHYHNIILPRQHLAIEWVISMSERLMTRKNNILCFIQ